MGIYDRDYMKAPQERRRLQPEKPSFRQRLRFNLWRLFRKKQK